MTKMSFLPTCWHLRFVAFESFFFSIPRELIVVYHDHCLTSKQLQKDSELGHVYSMKALLSLLCLYLWSYVCHFFVFILYPFHY